MAVKTPIDSVPTNGLFGVSDFLELYLTTSTTSRFPIAPTQPAAKKLFSLASDEENFSSKLCRLVYEWKEHEILVGVLNWLIIFFLRKNQQPFTRLAMACQTPDTCQSLLGARNSISQLYRQFYWTHLVKFYVHCLAWWGHHHCQLFLAKKVHHEWLHVLPQITSMQHPILTTFDNRETFLGTFSCEKIHHRWRLSLAAQLEHNWCRCWTRIRQIPSLDRNQSNLRSVYFYEKLFSGAKIFLLAFPQIFTMFRRDSLSIDAISWPPLNW